MQALTVEINSARGACPRGAAPPRTLGVRSGRPPRGCAPAGPGSEPGARPTCRNTSTYAMYVCMWPCKLDRAVERAHGLPPVWPGRASTALPLPGLSPKRLRRACDVNASTVAHCQPPEICHRMVPVSVNRTLLRRRRRGNPSFKTCKAMADGK